MAVEPRPTALKAIIAYKIVRAVISVLAGVTVLVLTITGLVEPLRQALETMHEHALNALWLWVTDELVKVMASRTLIIVAVLLLLDASVLVVEAWALYRGWKWAVWLVVIASGALLPWEVSALVSHPAIERVVVLLINLVIVGWLLWHARRPSIDHDLAAKMPKHPPQVPAREQDSRKPPDEPGSH